MTQETLATLLTGLGVIVAVWAIVRREIDAVNRRVDAINTRIDNILLADRQWRKDG